MKFVFFCFLKKAFIYSFNHFLSSTGLGHLSVWGPPIDLPLSQNVRRAVVSGRVAQKKHNFTKQRI